jgi:hypothetical protein
MIESCSWKLISIDHVEDEKIHWCTVCGRLRHSTITKHNNRNRQYSTPKGKHANPV